MTNFEVGVECAKAMSEEIDDGRLGASYCRRKETLTRNGALRESRDASGAK